MLRLTRNWQRGGIQLTLSQRRQQERSILWWALAIAVGIHLGAACLFRVQLVEWFGSETVFPPTEAVGFLGERLQIDTEAYSGSLRRVMPPPLAAAALPPLQASLPESPWEVRLPKQPAILRPVPHLEPPPLTEGLHLHIYGPLADFPVELPAITNLAGRARLAVRVDRNGEVFWLDWEERSGQKELDRILEGVVREMRFQVPDDQEWKGGIEIGFGHD